MCCRENPLDCTEFDDDIPLYAAGGLTPLEAERLRRHLASGCPNCAGKMAQTQATLALLAMSLPPQTPSAQARRQLLDRISGQARQRPLVEQSAPSRQAVEPISPWALLAIPSAIAATIAAAITIFFAVRMQNRPPVAVVPSPDMERTLGALSAYVQQQAHELDALRSAGPAQTVAWAADKNLKMIWLDPTANQPPNAGGRIFWDTDRGVWHFFAAAVKPADAGKTYELWFVKSDGTPPVAAGSFEPAPDGDATLVTNIPPDIAGKITMAAVTDESTAAPIIQPHGSFQLQGAVR
jgi:anti-sigma-K factor RskA